jgi:putative membrane protein
MTANEVGDVLARLNAGLNTTSLLLLVAGFVLIKKKRVELHRKCMQLAFLTSAVFLVSYLTRYGLTGSHHLAAGGWVKGVYYAILFSHMILAAATVPLALRALYLGRQGRFADHRRIARVTFPIWAYVSITGVIVYVVLYHVVGTVEASSARLTEPLGAPSVQAP